MKDNLVINLSYFLPATAAIIFSVTPIDKTLSLRDKDIVYTQEQVQPGYSWEGLPKNPYYSYENGYSKDMSRLIIVERFARRLVENIIDLDPIIAQKVNDNFWDLL